ncbi:retrovirus-related pol polyprotein from transposon TNT 1-94 [Tanacetum coccineum]|uniref:Retrovirus-related pol polyprotein from transposon TNT 1-94 n=1 Tax=Tanacetum coccineum TaxID=301880 RepID=A0ABQ5A0I5_9ASTR
MVKECIVLGHKILKKGIEVNKAKIDVIAKLPHPTTVKGIRSFLRHAGFYRRFIKDFSKISRPMTHLLEKNTRFIFFEECIQAFQTLKKKLREALILIAPDWDQPFAYDTAAPHYERKTRADRGKKRPREPNASSSSTTQNPSSSSLQIDVITDDNDVESPQSNSSSPSQTISSSSNVVSGVHQNPPHENHDLNNLLSQTISFQIQQRDEHRDGLRCYLLNDYDDVGKLKAKGDIGVFVGYSKESTAFRIYNKRTRKIHESVDVNFDKISEMASKQFSLEPGLSNLNEMEKSSNPTVSQVSKTSKKDLEELFHDFYDEYFDALKITKSLTSNVETSNEEISPSEEVENTSSNTQSVSNNMVPNVNEASTSHNVFNERLEDAYFNASTTFHDPSNIHTFYQAYPHEKKWNKDHPLHKTIGDPKSSVRTREQIVNSCLFVCLLSSIEPVSVAKALKDANWVNEMQEELDQFARLKVWRLVPRPEGKTIIKTKWIFKNKKDERSLVIRTKQGL